MNAMSKLFGVISLLLGILIGLASYKLVSALVKDVKQDIHVMHIQLDKLEDLVKSDVKRDIELIKDELNSLEHFKSCDCVEGKPPVVPVEPPTKPPAQRWYKSSLYSNIQFYGVPKDGVLTYKWYLQDGVVYSTTYPEGSHSTKDFIQ